MKHTHNCGCTECNPLVLGDTVVEVDGQVRRIVAVEFRVDEWYVYYTVDDSVYTANMSLFSWKYLAAEEGRNHERY
jgi:hypothetical protein